MGGHAPPGVINTAAVALTSQINDSSSLGSKDAASATVAHAVVASSLTASASAVRSALKRASAAARHARAGVVSSERERELMRLGAGLGKGALERIRGPLPGGEGIASVTHRCWAMNGWLRLAASMTASSSAPVVSAQQAPVLSVGDAGSTAARASTRSAPPSFAHPNPVHHPRAGRPSGAWRSRNSCQAGMIREGFRPSSCMSAKWTCGHRPTPPW